MAAFKPSWTKPSTLLFAAEIPVNEKAFAFALAQAKEFGANFLLFHSFDLQAPSTPENPGVRNYDEETAERAERHQLEPLAERVRAAGVTCEVIVRRGSPAEQILSISREREIDRIVMGTHSPGPVGKLLVGSVVEAVLRNAPVPVYIVGPEVTDGSYRAYTTRTVLCAVSLLESSAIVAGFAAQLASHHRARLILQHIIRPQEREELLAGRSLDDLEGDMLSLVPAAVQDRIAMQTIVVPGDPTEELLYQSRVQQADLIVLGAQGASAFAAVTRHGVVYKVLAHANCPVLTLSPVTLAECGSKSEKHGSAQEYMAGVI